MSAAPAKTNVVMFPTRVRVAPDPPLRVLVGVQGEGLNGIETYAEQVAAAGVVAGHDVTLLVTSPEVARMVRSRIDARVHVEDLGLSSPTPMQKLAGRLVHGLAMRRLERGLQAALAGQASRFDVAHLNHPALARAVRPAASTVVVTAWFYPHAPLERVVRAWQHNRGPLARRAVLAAKSITYYLGDARGFAAADRIVAPTSLLADQLRSRGLQAEVCPPPIQVAPAVASNDAGSRAMGRRDGDVRLVAVCGDLTHPRKNMGDAFEAARCLVRPGRRVYLEMIGHHSDRLRRAAACILHDVDLSFPGALDRAELHRRVQAADVLVLPSLYEEWGYVAVEALLLGTPVVTYPVYPFASMLDGGFGVVATGERPRDLAAAIEGAISGACRVDLAGAARDRFGAASVGLQLSKIWTEARKADDR